MPFKLSVFTEEDIPEFSILDELAMDSIPMARAMNTPGVPRRVECEKWMRKDWGEDPQKHWMKLTDEDSGEMVAAAMWRFDPNGGTFLKEEEPAPAPIEGAGGEEKAQEAVEQQKKDGEPNIFADLMRMSSEFKEEFVGSKPVAYLHFLATHPKYQRKGAGSVLVKWGCDKADEQDLMCALQATSQGRHVYTRHGFEIAKVIEWDLNRYGIDEVEIRTSMTRKPKSQRS